MPEESVVSPAAVAPPSAGLVRLVRWSCEILLMTAIFAAAGAWPTPDTNEAHYLARARHSWDPSWGAGDFFLDSPEAHGVFYRLLGPLAAALPLEQAAWIGRWLGWGSLAAGFSFLAAALLPTTGARILAAALFSLAARHTPAAGEWVIGGCESKVFAWALVLAGVGWFVRGRSALAWVWLGAATAFHPLVGGWAMLAFLPAALVGGKGNGLRPEPRGATVGLGPAVAVGIALAALGVVPALGLSAGTDGAERGRAISTYVVERLPHHLLVRTFADGLVARHCLAILLWWLLLPLQKASPARRRMSIFTAAALGVSLAGCAVSLLELAWPSAAHALLRYYWFRLADGIVPLGLALTATAALVEGLGGGTRRRLGWVAVLGMLAVDLAFESRHWPLPGRPGLVARADQKVQAAAWRDVCAWVRDHTPAEACFLTPRGATSFHWYTGRREVVNWKDIPQDARSILAWRARIIDCFSVDGSLKSLVTSTAALGPDRLLAAAGKYGADHIIVPVNALEPFPLPGEPLHVVGGYAVHRLDPPPATPP